MISFDDFSFWYPDAPDADSRPTSTSRWTRVSFALLVGRPGQGKSTLLRAVNGLVPHFTGGHVEGRVVTAGTIRGIGRRGSSPTSSAWSARTRWRAS